MSITADLGTWRVVFDDGSHPDIEVMTPGTCLQSTYDARIWDYTRVDETTRTIWARLRNTEYGKEKDRRQARVLTA